MLYITTIILMYCGVVILLYKTYQYHTKHDIKSYLWYNKNVPKKVKPNYRCYCDSIQLICEIHRNDPIANQINPKAVKAYWDRRDGIYNKTNEKIDTIMKKVKGDV